MSRIWWEPRVREFEKYTDEVIKGSESSETKTKALGMNLEEIFQAYEAKWTFMCLVFGVACFIAGYLLRH